MRLLFAINNVYRPWKLDVVCREISRAHHRLPQRSLSSSVLEGLVNWERKGIPKDAGTSRSNQFDLGRMCRLLDQFDNPQNQWPAVHVAGSKGKGSTVAVIAAALRAAGHKVGVYTSPHLRHISERISTSASTHISPDGFETIVKIHELAISKCQQSEGGSLSHFEVTTALAFRHFADEKVDIAVIETGMGGLTDATNVIDAEHLQLAVITSLGLEHVEALGGSLQSIAKAKAGIIKRGRPVVVSAQRHPEALREVIKHADAAASEAIMAEDVVKVKHVGYSIRSSDRTSDGEAATTSSALQETLDVEFAGEGFSAPPPASSLPAVSLRASTSLIGPHQHSNIATAVCALIRLRGLGWRLTDADISAGIQGASLPARFQVLSLPGGSGEGPRLVVLDGAHTPESAAALRVTLSGAFPGHPLVLVVAMASDKEHRAVVDELRRCAAKAVVFTTVEIAGGTSRSCAPGVLAGHWQASAMAEPARPGERCRQLIQASLPAAIDKAKHELSAFSSAGKAHPGVICVTGSLHAAAQAERCLRSQWPT